MGVSGGLSGLCEVPVLSKTRMNEFVGSKPSLLGSGVDKQSDRRVSADMETVSCAAAVALQHTATPYLTGRFEMRRIGIAALLILSSASLASAQECACDSQGSSDGGGFIDGGAYGGGLGAYGGFGGQSQLYPYDQQDTWLHGQYQRVPSYGGYNSFRPYNYRHVATQSQIASNWGGVGGMPYSQQFWNRYKPNYLNQNLYSASTTEPSGATPATTAGPGNRGLRIPQISPASFNSVERLVQPQDGASQQTELHGTRSPLHVYPAGFSGR